MDTGKGSENPSLCISCSWAKCRRALNDHRVVGSLPYISFERPSYTISHLLLAVNWHLKDIRTTVRAKSQLMAPSSAPASVKVREQPPSQWHADLFQVPKPSLTTPSPSSLTVSIIMIDANGCGFLISISFLFASKGFSPSSRVLLLQFQQKLMVEAIRSISVLRF